MAEKKVMKVDSLKSVDLTRINIEKLAELFPDVVVEATDENGNPVKKVDFEKLKIEVGEPVEDNDERYEFTWVGKKQAQKDTLTPVNETLRPCMKESKNWDATENLYIEGDNIDVLKMLQKSYSRKIKMIYIDPPYNTGSDKFTYRDDYSKNKDEYDEEVGAIDENGYRMYKNTENNGRFHSNWCSIMYPCLKLARNLLTNDGVIFISIDDHEVDNLHKICDEIFGESNFIATIVRNTNSSKNQSLFVSVSHEYCLIYSKSIETLKIKHSDNKWCVPKNNIKEYIAKVVQLKKEGLSHDEITEELKTLTKYPRFIDFVNYWYFDEKGLYMKGDLGGVPNGNITPIKNPLNGNYDPVPPGGFRFSSDKLEELIKENRIHFHTDGSLPRIKRYLSENITQRPKSIMSDDQRPDNALMQEFNTPFDNPKQLSFMKRIISIMDKDSLILDFFSGSATTAHAVMQLNAEDGGKRKFIMVQLPEICDEKSEAYKAGYKNICEIGKERIRKAGEKIVKETGKNDLDIGFRVFKVDSANVKKVDFKPCDYWKRDLTDLVDTVQNDRCPEDLLYGFMLDQGLDLSLPYKKETIEKNTVHIINPPVNEGDVSALIACFDEKIPEKTLVTIAKMTPVRVLFMEKGFQTQADRSNLEAIFKQYSPETKIKVM